MYSEFVKEQTKYERRVKRFFAADRFGPFGLRKNIFVLVAGAGEMVDGLCVEKILL